jgi:hypothetical protein
MADFRPWHRAGFTTELLPIIPPGVTLTEGSTVKEHHKGKTPGVLTRAGTWSGLGGKWSLEDATEDDVKKWHEWKASVGLQARKFPGLDIDVEDAALAQEIDNLATAELAWGAPCRYREGSPRRLILLKLRDGEPPLRKVPQPFRTPGMDPNAKPYVVELLALGQQYVVAGPHPKGGEYLWQSPPWELGIDNIPEITAEDVNRFFATLRTLLEAHGCTLGKAPADAAKSTTGVRTGLANPSLWAPSPQHVLDVLARYKPEHLGHDEFVQHMAAIKAALGPDREYHYPEVFDWAPGERSAEEEATRKVWDSIDDSSLGWSWLAATSGTDVAAQAEFDDGQAEALAGDDNNMDALRPDDFSENALAARFTDAHVEDVRYAAKEGRWLVAPVIENDGNF